MLNSFIFKKKSVTCNPTRQDLARALWDKEALVWVDLENPSEFESEILIELFNFHPLAIEDCLSEMSESKIDDYEDHLFLIVHAINPKVREELGTIEVDIFVSKNYVVTFHKEPVPSVVQLRDGLQRKAEGSGFDSSDMLLHAVLDRLVDRYLSVITEQERKIDEIEDQVFVDGSKDFLPRILKIQKDVLHLKRIINPQRETINALSRNAYGLIKQKHLIYYRDIDDHLFRFYQMAEELHGLLTGIFQVYFSHVSAKLNEVIKTMTIIATISLPPMVIASIYGMNFKFMPELNWQWGFLFSLGLMTVSSGIVLIYMKFKKWF